MNTLETASMTLIPAGTQQPIKGPSVKVVSAPRFAQGI